eukprot:TRINITY_DN76445_c0_g1_i1.p1 TRINITY_DN76445_c0_g1~~TRINITY_DN76445_c0_g1_i1.p1  ORF type:complete len:324 (+),score=45.19 TRINITY_DN76445_c0_g1_i1:40-1011(+)
MAGRCYNLESHGALHDAQFDSTGRWLATASSDGVIRIWSTATSQLVAELKGHRAQVLCLAWADGRFSSTLASGSSDGQVTIWRELQPGCWNSVHQMNVPGAANSIAFSSPDPALVLAVGSGDELGILTMLVRKETASGEQWQVKSITAHDGGVASLTWAPTCSPAVLASGPAIARAANALKMGAGHVRRLATCGADGCVHVWRSDIRGEHFTRESTIDDGVGGGCAPLVGSGMFRCVAWRPNMGLPGSHLAGSRDDGTVVLWAQDSLGLPWKNLAALTVPGDARRLTWAQGGTFLAVSVGDDHGMLFKESAGGEWVQFASVND